MAIENTAAAAAAAAPPATATVVGAGPAGLFAVGALLDLGATTIRWLDPDGVDGAGRLKRYGQVPSNTKVRLFTRAARAFASFEAVWARLQAAGGGQALAALDALNPDDECPLRYAADMLRELAAGLLAAFSDRVQPIAARVERIAPAKADSGGRPAWTVAYGSACHTTTVVVLATGAFPAQLEGPAAPHAAVAAAVAGAVAPRVIDLDDALAPDRLAGLVAGLAGDVAVVGSSHSAVLVLKNLAEGPLAAGTAGGRRIKNFARAPFKYAEYLDETTIRYDNTGLKGAAAAWARRCVDDGAPEPIANLDRIRLAPGDEAATYRRELPSCGAIVYAVGFARTPLPTLVTDAAPAGAAAVDYGADGQLIVARQPCPGLYGFGIAFPERVVDVSGEPELAVGLWKFVRHIRASLTQSAAAYFKN